MCVAVTACVCVCCVSTCMFVCSCAASVCVFVEFIANCQQHSTHACGATCIARKRHEWLPPANSVLSWPRQPLFHLCCSLLPCVGLQHSSILLNLPRQPVCM